MWNILITHQNHYLTRLEGHACPPRKGHTHSFVVTKVNSYNLLMIIFAYPQSRVHIMAYPFLPYFSVMGMHQSWLSVGVAIWLITTCHPPDSSLFCIFGLAVSFSNMIIDVKREKGVSDLVFHMLKGFDGG